MTYIQPSLPCVRLQAWLNRPRGCGVLAACCFLRVQLLAVACQHACLKGVMIIPVSMSGGYQGYQGCNLMQVACVGFCLLLIARQGGNLPGHAQQPSPSVIQDTLNGEFSDVTGVISAAAAVPARVRVLLQVRPSPLNIARLGVQVGECSHLHANRTFNSAATLLRRTHHC